jgi:hypothetical protein
VTVNVKSHVSAMNLALDFDINRVEERCSLAYPYAVSQSLESLALEESC